MPILKTNRSTASGHGQLILCSGFVVRQLLMEDLSAGCSPLLSCLTSHAAVQQGARSAFDGSRRRSHGQPRNGGLPFSVGGAQDRQCINELLEAACIGGASPEAAGRSIGQLMLHLTVAEVTETCRVHAEELGLDANSAQAQAMTDEPRALGLGA
jgi:hypothetical protein